MDQYYSPPEGQPVSVSVLHNSDIERVELREYRYTRVEVMLRKGADGRFAEAGRELVGLRINPWWYPHSIHAPKTPESAARSPSAGSCIVRVAWASPVGLAEWPSSIGPWLRRNSIASPRFATCRRFRLLEGERFDVGFEMCSWSSRQKAALSAPPNGASLEWARRTEGQVPKSKCRFKA